MDKYLSKDIEQTILQKNDNNICFTFDKNYIREVYVATCSILANNLSLKLVFHFIYSDIPDKTIQKLVKYVESHGQKAYIYEVNIENYTFCPLTKYDWRTHMAYCRINICHILPESIKKVLYLDPDIIIKANLSDLFNTNIETYPFGAVMIGNGYFNSGVLLLNLENWRTSNISDKIFSYIKENPESLEHLDQSALNAVIDSWLELPPKYNVGMSLYDMLTVIDTDESLSLYNKNDLKEAFDNPAIIHYAGSFHFKPWYKDNINPYKDEYLKYLKKIPYKNKILKFDYILAVMKAYKITDDKEITNMLANRIKKAFKRKNLLDFLIIYMYNNPNLKKYLYPLFIRLMYIRKCLFI